MNNTNIITTITMITAVVGAACGIAGLVLGIINIQIETQRTKVRLKIVPKWMNTNIGRNASFNFEIEVINLSEFPVTISEIGLLPRRDIHSVFTGYTVQDCEKSIDFLMLNSKESTEIPYRLEPHTSCTERYFSEYGIQNNYNEFEIFKKAYAQTQDGTLVTNTSKTLKQMIKRVFGNEK